MMWNVWKQLQKNVLGKYKTKKEELEHQKIQMKTIFCIDKS